MADYELIFKSVVYVAYVRGGGGLPSFSECQGLAIVIECTHKGSFVLFCWMAIKFTHLLL